MSVVPDNIDYLMSFIKAHPSSIGRKSEPADLHCTVCYSQNSLDANSQWYILNSFKEATAYAKSLTSWIGHGDEGFVVLELECPALVKFNQMLRQEYGLDNPDFPEYNPHITLVSNLENIQPNTVKIKPFPIKLSGLRIENVKG